MAGDAVVRELWSFADGLTYADLDEDTIETAKLRLFDTLAVATRAMEDTRIERLLRYVGAKGGSDEGAILGTSDRAAVEYAGFANAAMIRHLDWNDTYLSAEAAHPSGNIGGLIAYGDARNLTGRELVLATVIAYEIQCRLCDQASFTEEGFDHVNYGLVSMPIALGAVLGFDEATVTDAIGIAATGNLGTLQARQPPISEWKGYAFANAVRNAIVAIELTSGGVGGPADPFEGAHGLDAILERPIDPDALDLGPPYRINETHLKAYPICHHILAGIDALFEIQAATELDPDDVEAITIETYDIAIRSAGGEETWRPTTHGSADHSIPYCVTRALLDGPIHPDDLAAHRLDEPDVIELMDRITIRHDETFTDAYGEAFPHRLKIDTPDESHETTVRYPRGHYRNPLDWDAVASKLTEAGYPGTRVGRLRSAVAAMDDAETLAPIIDACAALAPADPPDQHT